jgi:urease beta subunit
VIPGDYLLASDPIEINAGRPTRRLEVANTGDRPVQVGSHFHFFEVNRCLVFDRAAAYGMRLNIASGTAVRFEPGDTHEVELVAIGGRREVIGLNRLVDGALDADAVREAAMIALNRFVRAQPCRSTDGRTPATTARRPATAFVSPTPTSSLPSSTMPRCTGTRRYSAAARSFETAWGSRPRQAARPVHRIW